MSLIIEKKIKYLLLLILLISCNQHYNTDKIHTLSELKNITNADLNELKELQIKNVQNALKLAQLNLAKIEDKKLDSIEIELIYFEYRDYLNCVNNLHESAQKITPLINVLYTNQSQLKNITSDYVNSKERRSDLDPYFIQENNIVKETSIKVHNIIQTINQEQLRLDTLNNQIEEIIN